MGYQEFLPAPALQPLIHRYGIVEIADELRVPVKEKLVPVPGYCWLFTRATHSPLYIERANHLDTLSPILEISQNSRSTTIIHSGAFRMFYVKFKPGVIFQIEHASQFNSDPGELYAYFIQTHSADSIVNFADKYFSHSNVSVKPPDTLARETIKRIHSNPAFTLRELSRDLYFSPRHLRRVFSLYTGVPLKAYHQIVRFSHCIQQLEGRKDQRILEVACHNGFSDQTHFNKEFKLFTGLTPKQYLSGQYPLTTGLMWRDSEKDMKW